MIECPNCHYQFTRQTGKGASYAKDMKKLSLVNMKILVVWFSNKQLRDGCWEKKILRNELKNYGLEVSEDPFNARISELLGLGIISATPQIKSSPTNTSRAPEYVLNIPLATKIINKNGRLG